MDFGSDRSIRLEKLQFEFFLKTEGHLSCQHCWGKPRLVLSCLLLFLLVTNWLFQGLHQWDCFQTMVGLHDVNIPTEKATFAMGCFWGPDSLFGATMGVIRTRVGFTGGSKKAPAYKSLGDHTEAIEIDFDPETIKYEQLLNMFWSNHDPTARCSRQVSPLSKIQEFSFLCLTVHVHHFLPQRGAKTPGWKNVKRAASQSQRGYCDDHRAGGHILRRWRVNQLKIKKYLIIFFVYSYHQKYRLQQYPELMAVLGLRRDIKQLTGSHVAARLNGYVVGAGGVAQFEDEADRLGLPEAVKDQVRKLVTKFEGHGMFC